MKKMEKVQIVIIVLMIWVLHVGLYAAKEDQKTERENEEKETKQLMPVSMPEWTLPQLTPQEPETAFSKSIQITEDGAPGITAEQLDEQLKGSLAGMGSEFVSTGTAYGIRPEFLAAVCALESGWGDSKVAVDCNNLAGICRADGTYKRFASRESSVEYLAALMKYAYCFEDGRYYSGSTTVDGIAVHFHPADPAAWASAVGQIMENMEAA